MHTSIRGLVAPSRWFPPAPKQSVECGPRHLPLLDSRVSTGVSYASQQVFTRHLLSRIILQYAAVFQPRILPPCPAASNIIPNSPRESERRIAKTGKRCALKLPSTCPFSGHGIWRGNHPREPPGGGKAYFTRVSRVSSQNLLSDALARKARRLRAPAQKGRRETPRPCAELTISSAKEAWQKSCRAVGTSPRPKAEIDLLSRPFPPSAAPSRLLPERTGAPPSLPGAKRSRSWRSCPSAPGRNTG